MDHVAGGLLEAGLADVMASFFVVDDGADPGCEVGIRVAAAHAGVEVVVGLGEEAGAQRAV